MKPALFLDRDGTINYDPGYVHKLEDLKLFDDIVPIIKEYNQKGFFVLVLTNQSGINRGYFTEKELNAFNEAIKKELTAKGAIIDAFYYCPHRPDENCNCRKPKTGLIELALKDFDIDVKNSIIIGDRDNFEGEMARRLGIAYKILKR